MKNVSTEFRKKVENGSACYAYANVVLRNGTKLTLDPSKDFRIDGNSITTNGGSSFPLGVALSRTIELNLDNYDGRFDAIDFYGAEITLFTGMTLDDGSVEKIKEGIFSVVEPTTPGSTITLVAADYMAKTSDSYVANTTFPATIFNIYRDVCIQCNLVAGSAKFTNGDFVVDAISENVTCREMLGYIAMIAGGNAMCDSNGAVIIKSYDFSGLKKSDGTYDYTKAQNFSGFQKNPSISTDMIRITGVKAENDDGDEKQSYIVGSEDYCFLIENPLISGKEAQALQLIGNVIVGLEFYTFSGDHISNPLAEFMDPCFVQDMKGNLFFSVLSNITYTYLGSTSISCDTDSPETVKSQKATSGSKVYQNLKKQQQVIKKEFEKQMDALEKQVSNAPGTYISSEVQPDGSSIYYLHDKPTLAESKSVFKITADTITASTDGGKTWNGGFTVDGVMIAKIMTTIGINFDWGVGGTLIIQDRNGKQTVYMDAETGEVRLSVVSLSIQGETVADIAEKKAESSLNDFTSNIYNPMISSLQKQIDGQIETFYYDYEPTLNNVPAKEWDTEEKKTAHEGDLFYWKSKGYAYRFQKDGSAWNWQLVQDTDITLAMQKAAEAKDTADSKRRVFTATPYPPYDVGDLWVGNDTSDLMRCQRSRQSGAYDSSDWIKAVKYTDDSELNNFIYTDYAEALVEISKSIDKKAETWFQATDPALQWTDNSTSEPLQDHTGANITDSTGANILTVWEREKAAHNGDLWHNTTNNVEYIYKDGSWHEMSVPDDVFDKIDGKAQIFVGEPIPPYDVGDTWFTGTNILVCVVKRTSGKYNASDWAKKDTYTDDTALENFLSGDYKETIANLSTQIDGKAETWRQSTDPAANWTTDELKAQHKGDLWNNTENQKTYIYNGSAWQEMTSTPPQAVFDAIDGKAQIFVKQPTTPYDVGDLWFDSSSADIMTCTTARESGNFNATDWEKRNKYTDDSSLNNWIKGEYANTLADVKNQIDGKAETWRQSTDPAKSWTTDALKKQHKGDLWYNTTEQKSYIYSGTAWEQMKAEPPSGVYDAIDGKAQIFVSQPKPPYSIGDLWFDSSTADIMTCVTARESGSYVAGDWQKRNKYTDDSAVKAVSKELGDFITAYDEEMEKISNSIDKKAETWYQTTDPSLQWTGTTEEALLDHTGATVTDSTGAAIMTVIESEKMVHDGDLWKNPSTNKEYIYQAGIWHEMSIPNDVFDIIDGKAQIFVSQPKPPYSVGDLWFDSTSADIMTCVTARESGSYVAGDWQKRNKYTDNSAVDALDKALTQLEIFNRLTNNGAAQGLFLKDGKLYLNFSYAQGGTLKLGGVNNGNGQAEVYDSSGNKIGSWNKDGFNLQKGSIYGTQIHLESQNDYIQGTVNGNEAVKISTGGVKVDSTANWGLGVTRKEYIFEMNPYVFSGVRLLDRSTGAGIGSTWTSGHFGMCYTDDLSGYSSVTDSLSNYGVYMKAGKEDANGGFYVIGNGLGKGSHVTAEGIYTSGTKNRIVDTENYGQRLQYCYEMPSPFFGDIGEAETDENGLCYVQIDDIFGETVLRNDKYNVFLQKEGCGDLWIEEKTADYFLVKGTPNLSFSWELKAKQADYTLERLEKNETPYEKEPELDYSEIGYQTYIDYVESKIIA
nr:MAG: Prophage endopeptidase tail [Bacteriophage sp.]